MRDPLETRIRAAFAAGYVAPSDNLGKVLRGGPIGRHEHPRRLARLAVVVAVALVVAVGISVPRVVGNHGETGSSANFPGAAQFGYRVLATAENLRGRGGTTRLGIQPAGQLGQVVIELSCSASGREGRFSGKYSWAQVEIRQDGRVVGGASYESTRLVQEGRCAGGGFEREATGLRPPGTAQRISITSVPGITWRAALEVGNPSLFTLLPTVLGTCPSHDLGWGMFAGPLSTVGMGLYASLDSGATKSGSSCALLATVRVGIYFSGSTTPIAQLPTAESEQVLSGRLVATTPKGSVPLGSNQANWTWGNWCGARRDVQVVFFGPNSSILGVIGAVVPPGCHRGVRGLDLRPRR